LVRVKQWKYRSARSIEIYKHSHCVFTSIWILYVHSGLEMDPKRPNMDKHISNLCSYRTFLAGNLSVLQASRNLMKLSLGWRPFSSCQSNKQLTAWKRDS
jgi:hypothetical protein